MKKVFLLLTAAVFSLLSANAQTENDLVVSAGDIRNITLGDDMKVVLVNAKDIQGEVKISREAMAKLQVRVADGAMILEPRRRVEGTVYIMVNNVTKVTLGENTNLTSDAVLKGNVDLYVREGAYAKLKTTGKLNAYPLGEMDVKINRTFVYLNASANIN